MGSINAQVVAGKISGNIRKGKKVVLAKILKDSGYSDSVANSPTLVTNTVAFQKAMELEKRPLIDGLQKEINRIKDALASKNLRNEEYRTLVASLDVLTRNYQLLSGGATERQVFVLPSEVMARNNITQTEDVKQLNGSTEPPITQQ